MNSQMAALVEQGARRVAEIEKEDQIAADAREAKQRAMHAEQWAAPLAAAHAALPEWMRSYLEVQESAPTVFRHGETEYCPMGMALPGLAPIRVYSDGINIGYSVPRATLWLDDEGSGEWQATYSWPDYSATRWQIQQMTNEIAVAVYQAQQPALEHVANTATAYLRNAQLSQAETAQPAPVVTRDPLERIADALEDLINQLAAMRGY